MEAERRLNADQQALALKHLQFALWTTKRYRRSWEGCHLTQPEALAWAQYALCRAALNYRPRPSASFLTYANRFIRGTWKNVARDRKWEHCPRELLLTRRQLAVVTTPGPEPEPDGAELIRKVLALLAGMYPRLARVLRRRFYDGWNLQQIGDELGVSRERVRQLEARAIRHCQDLAPFVAGRQGVA